MDPITPALFLKAAIPITQGIMGAAQAKSQKERAEANAYIGRTRAIQTDASARFGLSDELSTMRNAFGGAGQAPGVGTLEIMRELRRTRDSERRVNYGNRMSEAADYRAQARGYGGAATASMLGGFIKAGPSLFDIYDYKTRS